MRGGGEEREEGEQGRSERGEEGRGRGAARGQERGGKSLSGHHLHNAEGDVWGRSPRGWSLRLHFVSAIMADLIASCE